MGGNALKNTVTRRYEKAEYDLLVANVFSKLTPLLPNIKLREVKAYETKQNFGDLDLVVEDSPGVREKFLDYLNENDHEIVIDKPKREHKASKFRPPTWSVSWNGDFQVDFLFHPPERYEFACFYYNFPDLGNFLGHMARKFGLKLGHKGLFERLYDGTHLYAIALISMDIDKVLKFLGYDPDPIKVGFKTPEDIFAYTASSVYFDPEMFSLETASYKDRIRDSKRPMYNGLLAWIADKEFAPKDIDAKEALIQALVYFDGFAESRAELVEKREREKRVKLKFHGHRVKALTGLNGKDVGVLMNSIREYFGDKEVLNAKIDLMSESELDDLILLHFKKVMDSMSDSEFDELTFDQMEIYSRFK